MPDDFNPEHKRIIELANGWEGSEAEVSLSPADAKLLESVGAPVQKGKRERDPAFIVGKDLFDAAEKLQQSFHETPEGAQPTPNQQSVTGPGTDPDPNKVGDKGGSAGTNEPTAPETDDGLEDLTVAELHKVAKSEDVDVTAHGKKADIVAAIRKGRKK